jgi:hypothetical protein
MGLGLAAKKDNYPASDFRPPTSDLRLAETPRRFRALTDWALEPGAHPHWKRAHNSACDDGRQPPFGRHWAETFILFGRGLFIRQHTLKLRENRMPSRLSRLPALQRSQGFRCSRSRSRDCWQVGHCLLDAGLEELGHQAGPPGLLRGANALAVVPVEIFVAPQVIAEMRIRR